MKKSFSPSGTSHHQKKISFQLGLIIDNLFSRYIFPIRLSKKYKYVQPADPKLMLTSQIWLTCWLDLAFGVPHVCSFFIFLLFFGREKEEVGRELRQDSVSLQSPLGRFISKGLNYTLFWYTCTSIGEPVQYEIFMQVTTSPNWQLNYSLFLIHNTSRITS